MHLSEDVETILHRAQRLAARAGREMDSFHVLLATLTHDSPAGRHLASLDVREDALVNTLKALQAREGKRLLEDSDILCRIEDHMHLVARWTECEDVRCLHLLMALVRVPEATAVRVLEASGLPAAEVRVTTLSRTLDLLALPSSGRSTDGLMWDTPLALDPHDPGPSEEEVLLPSDTVRARQRSVQSSHEE
jgi:ATP-dependent Clp protease ATP-binding subunit ClpA